MLWLIVKVVSRVSSTTTKPLEDAMVCYGEAVRNFLVTWSSGFVARTPKAGHRNIRVDGSLQAGIGEGSLELQFKSIPTLWRIEALCHSLYQPNTNAVITTKKSLTKYCGKFLFNSTHFCLCISNKAFFGNGFHDPTHLSERSAPRYRSSEHRCTTERQQQQHGHDRTT